MVAPESKPIYQLINENEAARRLGLAVPTLRKWRVHGGGPPFLKLGRAVRYDTADLDAWVDLGSGPINRIPKEARL